jgi:hypothetical protein
MSFEHVAFEVLGKLVRLVLAEYVVCAIEQIPRWH